MDFRAFAPPKKQTREFTSSDEGAKIMFFSVRILLLEKGSSLYSGQMSTLSYFYRVFHQFRQAKFDNGGSILSSSQFMLLL